MYMHMHMCMCMHTYIQVSATARNDLETLYFPSAWLMRVDTKRVPDTHADTHPDTTSVAPTADGEPPVDNAPTAGWEPETRWVPNPDERQMEVGGARAVARTSPVTEGGRFRIQSEYLSELNKLMRSEQTVMLVVTQPAVAQAGGGGRRDSREASVTETSEPSVTSYLMALDQA